MTREKALEEVACDACQRMFLDTNAGQKLAEFGAQSKQNKSFLEDLKRWIGELLDKESLLEKCEILELINREVEIYRSQQAADVADFSKRTFRKENSSTLIYRAK